ncbi:MAG TPA: hypothetical protein VKG62_05640 [Solirubrobacteraceae bacterium]|nr:hypothetical protein [Solirubrobacteraceae bacterium]
MPRSKKRFRDRSLAGKVWLTVLFAVSLALVASAEHDIHHRPADQVRGSKALWRLLSLNALGATGYFRWGRRAAEQAPPA